MAKALAIFLLLLSACQFETPDKQPNAPAVEQFTINGVAASDHQGPIITFATTVTIEAVARSQEPLERISILAEKNGADSRQLSECDRSPCRFAWEVTAADNGIYSFTVEAKDSRGALSLVPFSNALAIDIR
jgi:hypothetical protein